MKKLHDMKTVAVIVATFATCTSSPAWSITLEETVQPSSRFTVQQHTQSFKPSQDYRTAMLCTSAGEELQGGSKVCYYNCGGQITSITVSVGAMCPLSVSN